MRIENSINVTNFKHSFRGNGFYIVGRSENGGIDAYAEDGTPCRMLLRGDTEGDAFDVHCKLNDGVCEIRDVDYYLEQQKPRYAVPLH